MPSKAQQKLIDFIENANDLQQLLESIAMPFRRRKLPLTPLKYPLRRKSSKQQRKKGKDGLIELTSKEIENLPAILKPTRFLKKWIRIDLEKAQKQRVWKTATFITPEFFATRLSSKRPSTMYHICFETEKHIFYTKMDNKEQCQECDAKAPVGAEMLLTLQKLALDK